MAAKIVMATGKEQDAPIKLKTVYYFRTQIVKITHGSNIFESGLNVQRNLQINKYGATYAEVLDAETDQLFYSQSRRIGSGALTAPHYEWNPEETNTKFAVYTLLKDQ